MTGRMRRYIGPAAVTAVAAVVLASCSGYARAAGRAGAARSGSAPRG